MQRADRLLLRRFVFFCVWVSSVCHLLHFYIGLFCNCPCRKHTHTDSHLQKMTVLFNWSRNKNLEILMRIIYFIKQNKNLYIFNAHTYITWAIWWKTDMWGATRAHTHFGEVRQGKQWEKERDYRRWTERSIQNQIIINQARMQCLNSEISLFPSSLSHTLSHMIIVIIKRGAHNYALFKTNEYGANYLCAWVFDLTARLFFLQLNVSNYNVRT